MNEKELLKEIYDYTNNYLQKTRCKMDQYNIEARTLLFDIKMMFEQHNYKPENENE
jgi:hypothetical protein